MTKLEVIETIKDIPIGSKLQLVKKNGDIIEVVLASHYISAVEEKVYDGITVPELPPALTVQGKRWGTFRIEIEEIIKIAHIG